MNILYVILGGLLFRWRGSGKDPKDCFLNYIIKSKFPKQEFFALAYSYLIFLACNDLIKSIEVFLAISVSICMGWGLFFAMGFSKIEYGTLRSKKWYYRWIYYLMGDPRHFDFEQRAYFCYIFMTMRGLYMTALAGAIVGSPFIAISGAMMGLIYYYCRVIGRKYSVKDDTALCEWCYGMWLFISLSLTFR